MKYLSKEDFDLWARRWFFLFAKQRRYKGMKLITEADYNKDILTTSNVMIININNGKSAFVKRYYKDKNDKMIAIGCCYAKYCNVAIPKIKKPIDSSDLKIGDIFYVSNSDLIDCSYKVYRISQGGRVWAVPEPESDFLNAISFSHLSSKLKLFVDYKEGELYDSD